MTTVTQDYTSVSWTTGSHYTGAILSVKRRRYVASRAQAERIGMWVSEGPQGHVVLTPMDADGRRFESSDAAKAFALEHGYLREYFTHADLRAQRLARAAQ